jgi:hypothetical protein
MQCLSIEEERLIQATLACINTEPLQPHLSRALEQSWETGAFWYTLALSSPSPSVIFSIFSKHIRPLFCNGYEDEFNTALPFLFEKKVGAIAGRKLADHKTYDKNLEQAFEDESIMVD